MMKERSTFWRNVLMRKKPLRSALFLLLALIISISLFLWLDVANGKEILSETAVSNPNHRYTTQIPTFDVRDFGYQPVTIPINENIHHSPFTLRQAQGRLIHNSLFNPLHPIIQKTGPAIISPGAVARYAITISNFESITRTYRLTDTLPSQLAYVPNLSGDLTYDAASHALTWKGEIGPGKLDMVIEPSKTPLPYLDLAEFGVPDLCDALIRDSGTCDDATVTFNLGANGYRYTLYGDTLSQIVLSVNGFAAGNNSNGTQHPQWLPNPNTPNYLLAGLWRDVDMSDGDGGVNGRFHAAILSGLVEGYDIFYAQWHDVPHALDPDQTVRFAIAVVLDEDDSNGSSLGLNGHTFFIYDNIADPASTIATGYTIGVEDRLGERGTTYAYAGADHLPQGTPPEAGTTLHLYPALFGTAYTRTFTYDAVVNAQVPEIIVNTAVLTSSSPDPFQSSAWSTHYLHVRHQQFIPFWISNE
jgi:hypothetical protein